MNTEGVIYYCFKHAKTIDAFEVRCRLIINGPQNVR